MSDLENTSLKLSEIVQLRSSIELQATWRKPQIERIELKRTLVGQGQYDDGQTEAGTLDIT